jgi:hypothetical protein
MNRQAEDAFDSWVGTAGLINLTIYEIWTAAYEQGAADEIERHSEWAD